MTTPRQTLAASRSRSSPTLTGLSPRRRPTLTGRLGPDGRALAVLGLVWLAFFGRLFIPLPGIRASFPAGDFVDQFYAFSVHEMRELQAGRLPLWGPYAFAGHPFLADVQSAIFYPISLVFSLIAAFVLGRYPLTWLMLEAAVHFLLAGVFTYALGRRLFHHRGAALIAALTFTYGGYLTGYPPLQLAVLETNIWLPLVLLLLDRAIFSQSRAVGWAAAAGLVWGVAILAGHPQSVMYLSYVALLFAAVRLWWAGLTWRRAAPVLLAPVIALGLAAAQWSPSLQYMQLSVRASATYEALAGGFPYHDLAQFVVPSVLTLWSPLYVGILPLALAGVALIYLANRDGVGSAKLQPLSTLSNRMLLFWAALAAVALILSLGGGTPLFRVFYAVVPGFDLFRSQERAAYVVSFALAMLAGYGYLALESHELKRAGRWLLVAGALALAAAAVVLADTLPAEAWIAHGAIAFGFAVMAGAWLRWSPRLSARRRLVLAVALIAADLWLANGSVNLVPPYALSEAYPPSILEPILQDTGEFRVRNEWRLPSNYGFVYQIEDTWGASPLHLQTYNDLWFALDEERRWDFLGIKYVISWYGGDKPQRETEVLAQLPISDTEITFLHRLAEPPPLTWLARHVEVMPNSMARLGWLGNEGFAIHEAVVLEEDPPIPVAGGPLPGDSVRIVERRPGRVVLDVTAGEPALLVVSEIHYPGWRATVDGEPVALMRADHALMALPVDAGRHAVELRFAPQVVVLGLAITLLTLSVAVLLALRTRRS